MNKAAILFTQLLSLWSYDAASPEVEIIAANLVSEIACTNEAVCVGVCKTSNIPQTFGLVYFLQGYGLTLRERIRSDRKHAFLYVSKATEIPSEFAGNICMERFLEGVVV